jgi:hypothetical protein
MSIALSSLAHTWLIDLDGTILKHNGHKSSGDELLPGVLAFWKNIPETYFILLLSAREEQYRQSTLEFLSQAGLRFDQAIFGLPQGERVLLNDVKPRGLQTALAFNLKRDEGLSGIAFELTD